MCIITYLHRHARTHTHTPIQTPWSHLVIKLWSPVRWWSHSDGVSSAVRCHVQCSNPVSSDSLCCAKHLPLSWIYKLMDHKLVIFGSCSTVVFGNEHDVGIVAIVDAVLGSASSFCNICIMKDSDLDDYH